MTALRNDLLRSDTGPSYSSAAAERDDEIAAELKYRAARVAASNSIDTADAALLLDMLGISARDGLVKPDTTGK